MYTQKNPNVYSNSTSRFRMSNKALFVRILQKNIECNVAKRDESARNALSFYNVTLYFSLILHENIYHLWAWNFYK